MNCPKTQPESHGPANLKKFSFRFYFIFFTPTSERNLLRVGFTKSVVVTLTVEEKVMSMMVSLSWFSYKNFASVWVVLQGRGQSDTELPSTKSYTAS